MTQSKFDTLIWSTKPIGKLQDEFVKTAHFCLTWAKMDSQSSTIKYISGQIIQKRILSFDFSTKMKPIQGNHKTSNISQHLGHVRRFQKPGIQARLIIYFLLFNQISIWKDGDLEASRPPCHLITLSFVRASWRADSSEGHTWKSLLITEFAHSYYRCLQKSLTDVPRTVQIVPKTEEIEIVRTC